MEARVEQRGRVTIVAPVGRIDFATSQAFERTLAQAVDDEASHLVVDLGEVDFLSSAGIRALITASRRLSAGHGALVLCGLRETVRQVLSISGLLPLFTVVASPGEAVARLAGSDGGQGR